MFEKVNPCHPDKIADRIAGALVDLAYSKAKNPRVAVEVLIGHGLCTIVIESSYKFEKSDVKRIVDRIAGKVKLKLKQVKQDIHLAANQCSSFKCGDNGIFKGMPITQEQRKLCDIAKKIYCKYGTDGKYVLDNKKLIICQSRANTVELERMYPHAKINPLGYWTGGIDVDSGATNRKLGSDMGDSVTGGGLHGKDLSKADVSVNIYAFLKAQETGKAVRLSCAIGDTEIDGKPYEDIMKIANDYIRNVGGFEKFAEWGLVWKV